jgi:hypothetical protein
LDFTNGYEQANESVQKIYGGEFNEKNNTVTPLVVSIPSCQIPFGLNFSEDPDILKPYKHLNQDLVNDSNILLREEIFGPVFPVVSYP